MDGQEAIAAIEEAIAQAEQEALMDIIKDQRAMEEAKKEGMTSLEEIQAIINKDAE